LSGPARRSPTPHPRPPFPPIPLRFAYIPLSPLPSDPRSRSLRFLFCFFCPPWLKMFTIWNKKPFPHALFPPLPPKKPPCKKGFYPSYALLGFFKVLGLFGFSFCNLTSVVFPALLVFFLQITVGPCALDRMYFFFFLLFFFPLTLFSWSPPVCLRVPRASPRVL